MSLNPALERQRQEDLCKFKASLVYRVSSRTQRNPVWGKKKRIKFHNLTSGVAVAPGAGHCKQFTMDEQPHRVNPTLPSPRAALQMSSPSVDGLKVAIFLSQTPGCRS